MKFTGNVTAVSLPSCCPPCSSDVLGTPHGRATSVMNRIACATVNAPRSEYTSSTNVRSTSSCCQLSASDRFQYRWIPARR